MKNIDSRRAHPSADGILAGLAAYLENLRDDGVTEAPVSGIKAAPARRASAPAQAARAGRAEVCVKEADSAVGGRLAEIAREIAVCKACVLCRTRNKTVPGRGCCRPDILFVGEGPGADEDMQGIPFVGRAGELLTRLIVRMGYTRDEVFIANVVKCRPPDNRKPAPEEMAACLPFLRRQIELLRPRVLVTLGATAAEGLLPEQDKIFITRLRGKWLSYGDIPLMPTFHPSYLLRNQSAMWDVWDDMQAVLKRLGRAPAPKK